MVDRVEMFEDRLRRLREGELQPSAFLARFREFFGIVPAVDMRADPPVNVRLLCTKDPPETFFPIFTSRQRFDESFFALDHHPSTLPLDTVIRQMHLDTGLSINPGTDFGYTFTSLQLQKELLEFGADTIVEEATPEWLTALNEQFARDQVSPDQRTWRAMSEWSVRNRASLSLDSPRARRIEEWFTANIKPGADHIGLMGRAAYYYDVSFWPIEIPLILGQPETNPCDTLEMPSSVRLRLINDRNELYMFLKFWADTIDFYYGLSDLRDPSALAHGLLRDLVFASREQLNTAALLLLEHRPNSKAAEAAALALEMILKAFLVWKCSLDEAATVAYRHNLRKLLKAAIEAEAPSKFRFLESKLPLFPNINDRYSVTSRPLNDLWATYYAAQTAGGVLLRCLTDRDTAAGMSVEWS